MFEFLDAQEAKDSDQPWFVWLAFNLAHITGNQRPNPMAVPNLDTLDERTRSEMQACGGQFGSANVGKSAGKATAGTSLAPGGTCPGADRGPAAP